MAEVASHLSGGSMLIFVIIAVLLSLITIFGMMVIYFLKKMVHSNENTNRTVIELQIQTKIHTEKIINLEDRAKEHAGQLAVHANRIDKMGYNKKTD